MNEPTQPVPETLNLPLAQTVTNSFYELEATIIETGGQWGLAGNFASIQFSPGPDTPSTIEINLEGIADEAKRLAAAQALTTHFSDLGWVNVPDHLAAILFPPEEPTPIERPMTSDEELDADDAKRAEAEELDFYKELDGDPDANPWGGVSEDEDPYA